ncbi:MAG TPA: flagellar basal-body MS-ring/collar protein FliF [Nitrospiria bacterium]|nr:flagellar basal-body MS-ring/collar protein FliF [Nitrospiria bacterium]
MANFLQQINQQLATRGLGKMVMLLMILMGAMAGMIVLWLWVQKPELQLLYSGLSSEDAAAVVGKLREARVPYEFSADGSGILVPADRVHELRLDLAGQGLPQGGNIGFELFDRNNFGMTEFVQKLNYRRALQGELARTIGQLAEVSQARVQLVIPERTLFADRQESPRASVVLTLRSGKNLSEGQTQGIIHLVASSVEGLNPEKVTVVDSHGRILSKPTADAEPLQMTNAQLDYQHAIEKDLEGKIQTMLERVVGPDKAAVRVSSVLDLRQVELTEEKFDPDAQVVRSEQRSQEQANGSSGSGPSGIPGVASNLPQAAEPPPSPSTTSKNSTQKKNETINYEISKTVSRIVEPIGTIKKLSVAVLVDGTYEATKGGNGQTARKYLPRSEEDMKKLEDLVKKAMGYSDARQDQVVVVNVPFETGGIVDEEAGAVSTNPPFLTQWLPMIRYGLGLVLAMIVLFFVIRPALKIITASPPAPAGASSIPFQIGNETVRPALPGRDQLLQIARENPQVTATVVKQWLREK